MKNIYFKILLPLVLLVLAVVLILVFGSKDATKDKEEVPQAPEQTPIETPEEPKVEPEVETPDVVSPSEIPEEPDVEPEVEIPEEPKVEPVIEPTPITPPEEQQEETKVEVISLTLDKTSVTLTEGESVTLTATIKPSNATNQTIGWTSYGESVASVKNGVITAHKAGSTVVTASVGTINVTCNVTVKAKNVDVTGISLDKSDVTLTIGEAVTLNATVSPDNATNKSIAWQSNNTAVVTVDSNGKITAISQGTATVTAKSGDKETSCSVTVAEPATAISSGTCGDNATWTLYNDGTLVISGTGAMYDYKTKYSHTTSFDGTAPWMPQQERIKKLIIEDGITTIGRSAFSYCENLTNAHIGEGVTNIGYSAFSLCQKLEFINIPDSVTNLPHDALNYCDSLTYISVGENNQYYSDDNGVLYNKDKTTLLQFPQSSAITSYNIPNGVTTIYSSAFYHCSKLTSLTIPDSVTEIGGNVFSYCTGISELIIPFSVKLVNTSSFEGWTSSQHIYVKGNSSSWNLRWASYNEAQIHYETYEVASGTCGENVTWTLDSEDTLTISGNGDIVYDVQNAGSEFWVYANNTDYRKWIKKVVINSGVRSIDFHTFSAHYPRLTEVIIADGVERIEGFAFADTKTITSITIPASVKTVESTAFGGWTESQHIYIKGSTDGWDENWNYYCKAQIHYEN